jgi:Ca2+-binding EF-hand superfamily protein
MAKLPEDKIREYRELFDLFDSDKDGKINQLELNNLLAFILTEHNPIFARKSENTQINPNSYLKIFNTESENRYPALLMKDILKDDEEQISLEDFLCWVYRKFFENCGEKSDYLERIRETLLTGLKKFCNEGEETIPKKKVLDILSEINHDLSEEEVEGVLNYLKFQNEDQINIHKFIDKVINFN